MPLIVFTTRTYDKKKNPLDVGNKLNYLRAAFPGITFVDVANVINALEHLDEKGVKHVTLVAGSDRIAGYKQMLERAISEKYVENLESFDIVALSRDPDADDVSGASATKARKFAVDSDLESFKQIAPSRLSDDQKESLFNAVRDGMGAK